MCIIMEFEKSFMEFYKFHAIMEFHKLLNSINHLRNSINDLWNSINTFINYGIP